MKKLFLLAPLMILTATSCKKNPVDRLTNPVPDGSVPSSSGIYVIYDDEFKTGGGLALIPGGESQAINLYDTSSPRRSDRQIRYEWNGSPVGGQQLFAGMQFTITPDGSTLASATGKNLSAPGYTKMILYVRGSLSTDNVLRIEGPSDGTPLVAARTELTSLTNNWQQVTLTVPSGDFTNVKIFATFSIQYTQAPRTTNPGHGGVIFIDDVRYER